MTPSNCALRPHFKKLELLLARTNAPAAYPFASTFLRLASSDFIAASNFSSFLMYVMHLSLCERRLKRPNLPNYILISGRF